MCGRFTLATPAEILAALFEVAGVEDWNDPRFNIAPQTRVITVRGRRGERQAQSLLWGAVNPKDSRPLINARSETVAPLRGRAFSSPPTASSNGQRTEQGVCPATSLSRKAPPSPSRGSQSLARPARKPLSRPRSSSPPKLRNPWGRITTGCRSSWHAKTSICGSTARRIPGWSSTAWPRADRRSGSRARLLHS
jgi:SOS response associated peptidase (SRAP)